MHIDESVYNQVPFSDFSKQVLSMKISRLLVHRDLGWSDLGHQNVSWRCLKRVTQSHGGGEENEAKRSGLAVDGIRSSTGLLLKEHYGTVIRRTISDAERRLGELLESAPDAILESTGKADRASQPHGRATVRLRTRRDAGTTVEAFVPEASRERTRASRTIPQSSGNAPDGLRPQAGGAA